MIDLSWVQEFVDGLVELDSKLDSEYELAEKAVKAISFKLRPEEMDPVKLSELEEADLIEDHERLHDYYQEWLDGEHRDEGDWSYSDLLKAHIFVVEELKKRGKECEYDDELAKAVKKLVERCKEAIESFVWDWNGEQVRIIIKGGEGSGWFAPPKGTHGEGGQGLGVKLLKEAQGWDELDVDSQKSFLETMAVIPEGHLEDLQGIKFWGSMGDSYGEYFYKEKGISLGTSAPPAVLMHEIGHHMEREIFSSREEPFRSFNKTELVLLDAKTALGRYGPSELNRFGLREYSLTDLHEFWADSYMLWGMARKGNSRTLEYQSIYRERFPDMAALLDRVWEG